MWVKVGSFVINPTSGMVTTMRFVARMIEIASNSDEDMQKEYYTKNKPNAVGETAFKYLKGKLSPFYSTVLENVTQHDYSGNTLPYSDSEPYSKTHAHKLSWLEYVLSKAPLPIAEGVKVYNDAVENQGADPHALDTWWNAIGTSLISGGTGIRMYESDKPEGEGYGSLGEYFGATGN